MHPDISEILIREEDIQRRVGELASRISVDYKNKRVTFIGVLKGSFVFLSDLVKSITIDCSVDFIGLSSYEGTKSTGIVRTVLDLRKNIEGEHVIIVEDIVDSGLTAEYLIHNLRTRRPKSIKICAILDKPSARKVKIPVKYKGFTIPDKFVVGYGLDYNETYRNLPYVGVLKKSAIRKGDLCR